MVVGLIVCALYSHFYVFKAYLEIDIETDSRLRTVLRVYWAEEGEVYSQSSSSIERMTSGRQVYSTFLGNLSKTNRIRIDPIEYAGKVIVRGLRISQPGFKPIELSPQELKETLVPVQQIADIQELSDGIVFNTTGSDGQFELTVSVDRSEPYLARWTLIIALILLFCIVVGHVSTRFGKDHGWVVICLFAALILTVIMSSLSRFNTHPDEYVHWQAVKYYSQHLLPPPLDSPAIAESYSAYGYSRLANFEVFYQFAGYAVSLLPDLKIPDYLKGRLINCLLFLALVILAARNKDFRIVAIPLLVSAQTWYLFSYLNSDAFGLFVAMLVAYQAVSRTSLLNRVLSEPHLRHKWLVTITIGLLLGLLLVVKTNYYFFALLVGLYFLWRLALGEFTNRRLFWFRAVAIGIVALTPYGTRLAMDMHANGFSGSERSALRIAMNEKYAEPQFKPSTPLADKHIYLSLKDRGVSVKRMLHRELWHTKSLYSALGGFGYTQYFSTEKFYGGVVTLCMLLIGVILISILLRGPPSTHVLFAMTGVVTLTLLVALFWYSWAVSFQPQGRYFAAMLPMFSILLFEVRRYLFPKIFEALVLALFLMAANVFLFVGLTRIEKIDSVANVFI